MAKKAVQIGIALAGTAVLSAGVATAASKPAPTVKACRTAKGALALTNAKGACAKGSSAVTLSVQGPAGATGPMGPSGAAGASGASGASGPQGTTGAKGDTGGKGDTGATGPGARKIVFGSNTDGDTGPSVALNGYAYTTRCSLAASDSLAITDLDITPPAGTSYRLFGTWEAQTGDTGTIEEHTLNNDVPADLPQSIEATAASEQRRFYWHLTLIDQHGVTQKIEVRSTQNGSPTVPTAPEYRCMIDAIITPAS